MQPLIKNTRSVTPHETLLFKRSQTFLRNCGLGCLTRIASPAEIDIVDAGIWSDRLARRR